MDFLTKMYTVRKNVCQMLEDRGFLVGEVSTEQLPVCWLHNVLTYACSRWLICVHVCLHCLQDDASLDLNAFRERFGDVPQKSELTLLCPLKEDPTEKVRSSSNPPPAQTQSLQW